MEADDFLGHNQYLIFNKSYHRARLAQWGPGHTDVGTYEHGLNPNQLWTLESHPHRPGSYHVINERNPQHRLTNHKHNFIVYNGPHFPDQLFKFVSKDDGYYFIQSAHYPEDWLTKHGVENSQVSFREFNGGDDQLWRLVPRFQARVYDREVFHFDNRQGSNPIIREISITTGIRRTSTSSLSNQTTYKKSISAALGLAVEVLDLGVRQAIEYENQLETSFSEEVEQSWSQTENITFTVPPGKNFKVVQRGVKFEGQIAADTCVLLTNIKVFESDSSQFDDWQYVSD